MSFVHKHHWLVLSEVLFHELSFLTGIYPVKCVEIIIIMIIQALLRWKHSGSFIEQFLHKREQNRMNNEIQKCLIGNIFAWEKVS